MELNKPFRLPAVLRTETSAAEDENHWVLSLQFGEFPTFRGVIGKLIVGEDRPGNNVRSHTQPPFLLEHDQPPIGVQSRLSAASRSVEPIGSARRAPRRGPRNTVSRARPFRCETP